MAYTHPALQCIERILFFSDFYPDFAVIFRKILEGFPDVTANRMTSQDARAASVM